MDSLWSLVGTVTVLVMNQMSISHLITAHSPGKVKTKTRITFNWLRWPNQVDQQSHLLVLPLPMLNSSMMGSEHQINQDRPRLYLHQWLRLFKCPSISPSSARSIPSKMILKSLRQQQCMYSTLSHHEHGLTLLTSLVSDNEQAEIAILPAKPEQPPQKKKKKTMKSKAKNPKLKTEPSSTSKPGPLVKNWECKKIEETKQKGSKKGVSSLHGSELPYYNDDICYRCLSNSSREQFISPSRWNGGWQQGCQARICQHHQGLSHWWCSSPVWKFHSCMYPLLV